MADRGTDDSTKQLTAKQERFVQGLVSGLSQREAYRAAYPASRASDKSMDELASKLIALPHVTARREALLSEHAKKALWTRERAVRTLIALADRAEAQLAKRSLSAPEYILLDVIRELNRLEQLYESGETGTQPVVIIDDI